MTNDDHGVANMMAFLWMDRNRRYFIASSSSLQEGIPYVRDRWRKVSWESNADTERVSLTVPQPKVLEVYYRACGKIDHHTRHRQDTLNLENKVKVHNWSKLVNMTLFGMMIVDAWLAFSGYTLSEETQKEFYMLLSEELIDNEFDNRNEAGRYRRDAARSRARRAAGDPSLSPTLAAGTRVSRYGVSAHITPTKQKRTLKDGTLTKYLFQGQCVECK